jgi:hypothetical protein
MVDSLLSAWKFRPDNFAIDGLNHPDPTGFFRTRVAVEQLLFDGGRNDRNLRPAPDRRGPPPSRRRGADGCT